MKKEILVLLNEVIEEKQGYKNFYHPELINKFIIKNNNLTFLRSFSEKIDEREENFKNCLKLKDKLFDEFCENLNFFFNKNFNKEYWRVIIGSWFHFAFETFYNRYYSVKNFLNSQSFGFAYIEIPKTIQNFASKDTSEFITNINNKNWNAFIYKVIFDDLGIAYQFYENDKIDKSNKIEKYINNKSNKNYLNKLFNFYNLITIRINKTLIVDTSFSKINNFILHLKLKKIPVIRFIDNFKGKNIKNYSNKSRDEFLLSYLKNSENKDETIFRKLLTYSIPLSLFENFDFFYKQIKSDKILNNLTYILSSQNYDENEYFKYIAFINKMNNNKLLYIQHGNNTGTSRFDNYNNAELTATNFFTWGHKHHSKHIPLFNVKVCGFPRTNKESKIGSHMIFYSLNNPIKRFFWDAMSEYNKAFNNQFYFIKNLSKPIQSKILFKYHNSLDSKIKVLIKDELKKINLNIKQLEKKKELKMSKIAIYSYDSTGFYEHLSLNKPVIGFWKDCLKNVNKNSQEYYLVLKNVGIIYEDHIELSNFINNNWENIENWWFSKNVQDAINFFISEYSSYENKQIKVFSSKIEKIITD